ncbi:MAG: hypothetical protein EAZ61_02705 [Oscillatoriales cyanobacterium]|nr:MAG: hypothetical protein EAZ61_02705 [Oscillatoriales cyanobacterium]
MEITPGEVRHLSGYEPSEVWRSSLLRDRRSRLMFWFQELLLAIALTPIVMGVVYLFGIRPLLGNTATVLWPVWLCFVTIPIAIVLGRWLWRSQATPLTLGALLDELDRYHGALKAAAIAEELAIAHNRTIDPTERAALVSAFELTRDDLIRAFTTDRILRENRDVLAIDFAQFGDSLTAIQALQTNIQGREYQEILQRTLMIGVSVRDEMRKLQH